MSVSGVKITRSILVCVCLCGLTRGADAATWYVATNGNDSAAGTNWVTAKATIQAAVDAAVSSDTVLVTNGAYATGARLSPGQTLCRARVVIDKAVSVLSVNGPSNTLIVGQGPRDDSAIRCVWMTNNALLTGFTLTNGFTVSGVWTEEENGGGVFAAGAGAVLSNCIIKNCQASVGGGAYRGTLYHCVLTTNSAIDGGGGAANSTLYNCTFSNNSAAFSGGGSYYSTLNDCTLTRNVADVYGGGSSGGTLNNCTLSSNAAYHGGGADSGTLNNCTLTANRATFGGGTSDSTLDRCTLSGNSAQNPAGEGHGGGAYGGTLNNCALSGNSVDDYGGGASGSTLNNCSLAKNTAGSSGGGSYNGTLNNCIVCYNTAPSGANCSGGTFDFGCTTPDPGGTNNIIAAPKLLNASHIAMDSPCVGAGSTNYSRGADIDGDAWQTPPAMGCDEPTPPTPGPLSVNVSTLWSNVAQGWSTPFLQGDITGIPASNLWSFGDGATLTNQSYDVGHAWANTGTYNVVLTAWNSDNPGGVSATVRIRVVEGLYYVRPSNPTARSPYTNWYTAATNIQVAVDVACVGGIVIVTNGSYGRGSRVWPWDGASSRLAVTNLITVRSVTGPAQTFIVGTDDVRCVYLAAGTRLSGFTVTNGQSSEGAGVYAEDGAIVSNCILTGNSASSDGGGAYGGTLFDCTFSGNYAFDGAGSYESTLNNCTLTGNTAGFYGGGSYGGTVNNCVLAGNSAGYAGGGSFGGTLNNCALTANSAEHGGGAYNYDGALNNCTVVGNWASWDGGGINCGDTSLTTQNNCIVYYNTAPEEPNYRGCSFNHSCTTPDPPGTGNITDEPELASASHLAAVSPCIGMGSSLHASGTDIDGEAWLSPPSIGCDEMVPGSVTGALSVMAWASYTNVTVGFRVQFRADISGRTTGSAWLWGDGAAATNRPYAEHAFSSTGRYPVLLNAFNESYPLGVTATVTVQVVSQIVHYVNVSNTTPSAPFTSWSTAATNIQQAISAASQVGALVLVTNGRYATGGSVVHGAMTNRVSITNAITVRGVNGPDVTIIAGSKDPVTTNGDAAVRCAYVGSNAALSGFTLTNGATRTSGDYDLERSGGGAWCELSGMLSNCVLTGNSAREPGGGSYHGTLDDCTLAGNWASWGGGASVSVLNRCTLSGNSAVSGGGGGASCGTLNNCLLVGNLARDFGGGSYGSTLNNCTIVSNSADPYGSGGGAAYAVLNNCIVYDNTASSDPNCNWLCTLRYSCTIPNPGGTGNITDNPQFVNAATGNYRLGLSSRCISRGNNAYAQGTTDLDGNPRIAFSVVDMGAYECQTPVGYWEWAGGITNGQTNLDQCATGDGYPNLLKYATGSSPSNSDALARMSGLVSNGLLSLRFSRNTNAVDARLTVEGANTLTNNAIWNGIATNIDGSWGTSTNVVESGSTNPLTVTVRDPRPATNRFLRLRVGWP